MTRTIVTRSTLNAMSTDELWALREKVSAELATRIIAEKNALGLRLKQLIRIQGKPAAVRRPYPEVFPKFRNPDHPSETWAGRGKQPRWLTAKLRTGQCIDDFRIERAAA